MSPRVRSRRNAPKLQPERSQSQVMMLRLPVDLLLRPFLYLSSADLLLNCRILIDSIERFWALPDAAGVGAAAELTAVGQGTQPGVLPVAPCAALRG
mmetsp:Transcript_35670/g.75604  ORF Transcript_35670/g.75604 Transcript_35670/m.75604 type:complete len:97 (+) Transcript_35670:530-820(+)